MPLRQQSEPPKHDSEYLAELPDNHPLVRYYWGAVVHFVWQPWWSFPS